MSNNLSSTDISELVCTRISHDIIGNIGAVSNAVELLEDDDPESFAYVKPILESCSKVLSARMKFFRLAFGLNNASVNNVEELKLIATNYVQTVCGRSYSLSLSLKISTPELYKIVLLGVMVVADVFIKGGTIDVQETTEGITFTANSEHKLSSAKLDNIKTVLANGLPEENLAQSAPTLYLKSLLKTTGVNMSLEFNEQSAVLQIG